MTTIRLSDDIETTLNQIAKNEHKSKSEIIKTALQIFIENYYQDQTPYELGKDVFGKYGSGQNNNSSNYKKILRDKINAKISH
jgi:predicted DNA-binding protein